MSHQSCGEINFADTIGVLASGQVWEYETGKRRGCRDVAAQTFATLQTPVDFPPIAAAIVSGDRVALAVDPNIPGIVEVLRGTIEALRQTEAGEIDIVLWDEATDATIEAIREGVGDAVGLTRHHSSDRASLRYVGADEGADPIYLNRLLVDADFVLPIVAGRSLDASCAQDLTAVFPSFADSCSRARHRRQSASAGPRKKNASASVNETSWLLGIQIMISVTASDSGQVGQVIAGTPEAIRKELTPSRRLPDEFPPAAPLVIASVDGDAQQQSWCNAARAIAAASRYVQPNGTIVLWSAIEAPPTGRMLNLADDEDSPDDEQAQGGDDFPCWDELAGSARTLARIAAEYRLLIHSRLDQEAIESMGLSSVETTEELARLSRSFDSCGVLRAAQFAGTTIDSPLQMA